MNIRLESISKTFSKGQPNAVYAVKDLSIEIKSEEFLMLLGANGSGKSTLLNLIAGTEKPDSGKIFFDDKQVNGLPEYRRSKWVARVFQNPFNGTAPDLSILDNFRLAAIRTQKKKLTVGINSEFRETVRTRIKELGMGLESKLDQQVGTLSGGQRQAITLLMSVMDKTRILLLDEPSAALDPKTAKVVLQLADRLIREYRLTAILITHNLRDAYQYGDRLVQMEEGQIIRDLNGVERSQIQPAAMLEWF